MLYLAAMMGCAEQAVPGDADAETGGSDWSIPDPSTYDCSAADIPDRASPTPISCAFDPTCRLTQVAAHRGGGGELGALAPEDTLSGFRAGIAIGVEYVETDPRPSADGVLVNLHDSTVDRTTDGTGDASAMTLAELQALHIDARDLDGDFSCERIPTLREILETCLGRVVVLVDANKTDRVDLLVGDILAADAVEWAIFDTSSLDKIDAALAIEPTLHIQIRPTLSEIDAQLAHFAPRLPEIVELEAGDRAAGTGKVHDYGTRSFSDVFIEDAGAISSGTTTGYETALATGLDILQTDRPDLVIPLLMSQGRR